MSEDNDFMSDLNALVSGASTGGDTTAPAVDNNVVDDVASKLDASFAEPKPVVGAKPPAPVAAAASVDKTVPVDPTKLVTTDVTDPLANKHRASPDSPEGKGNQYLDTYLQQDDKNNLVLADGTIIATAGKSRTFFQKMKEEGRVHRQAAMEMAQSNMQLGSKFKELYTEFTQMKSSGSNQLKTMTGMSNEELPDAIAIVKEYKINPVKAIKRLLTQARMRGIDLSEIGINGGVDPSIMREMMEAGQRGQQAPQEQQNTMTEERAMQEASDFLTRNPQAVEHVETLANAKRKFPEKSIDELWTLYRIHMTKMREQDIDSHLTSVVTPKPVVNPAARYNRPVQKTISAQPQDWAKMSFQQIADSIKRGE